MTDPQFLCTRCPKHYVYKTGLTTHIKNKHPVGVQSKKTTVQKQAHVQNTDNVPHGTAPTMATKPANPVENLYPRKTVIQFVPSNLDTQEIENLIEEEDEFFNAVEEFEHDIGINQSMIDWHRVNFESSFGNSGEFSGRLATVPHPKQCDDCETNSKIVDKQKELMMKQDKQLQELHKVQRSDKEKTKHNVQMLNETMRELALATKEITSLKVQLQGQKDTVLA